MTNVATTNTATVQEIYAAFGRGDIPAILGKLAEDIAWEHATGGSPAAEAGIAHLAPRTGRADVGRFFAALQALEFHGFEVTGLLEGEHQVVAFIRADVSVKATGKRFQDDEAHHWIFDAAGQVVRFRHYVDTAKHMAAMAVT